MSGNYLLDSNVAIRVLNKQMDLAGLSEPDDRVFLSLAVVGELLFGAEKSAHPELNTERVERLVDVCPVVPHDMETSRRYGKLKAELQQKGRPIPENDIWIAAAALQHGRRLRRTTMRPGAAGFSRARIAPSCCPSSTPKVSKGRICWTSRRTSMHSPACWRRGT